MSDNIYILVRLFVLSVEQLDQCCEESVCKLVESCLEKRYDDLVEDFRNGFLGTI